MSSTGEADAMGCTTSVKVAPYDAPGPRYGSMSSADFKDKTSPIAPQQRNAPSTTITLPPLVTEPEAPPQPRYIISRYGEVIYEDNISTLNATNTNDSTSRRRSFSVAPPVLVTPEQREKELAREKKWLIMLRDWAKVQKDKDLVKKRVRKGIPESMRGVFWVKFTGAEARKAHEDDMFHQKMLREREREEERARADIEALSHGFVTGSVSGTACSKQRDLSAIDVDAVCGALSPPAHKRNLSTHATDTSSSAHPLHAPLWRSTHTEQKDQCNTDAGHVAVHDSSTTTARSPAEQHALERRKRGATAGAGAESPVAVAAEGSLDSAASSTNHSAADADADVDASITGSAAVGDVEMSDIRHDEPTGALSAQSSAAHVLAANDRSRAASESVNPWVVKGDEDSHDESRVETGGKSPTSGFGEALSTEAELMQVFQPSRRNSRAGSTSVGPPDPLTCTYYQYLSETPSFMDSLIAKDVPRTFPTHALFSGTYNGFGSRVGSPSPTPSLPRDDRSRRALARVCRAVCNYDPELGYCQGISFLAAAMLTYLDAEMTFWVLISLLNDSKYGSLRDLFLNGFKKLKEMQWVVAQLMAGMDKKLHAHLESTGFEYSMVLPQWFMCLFVYSLPLPAALRIWDILFYEGPKVLYRAAVYMLRYHRKRLLKSDTDEVFVLLCQQLGKDNDMFRDIDTFIEGILDVDITSKQIDKLIGAYHEMQSKQTRINTP